MTFPAFTIAWARGKDRDAGRDLILQKYKRYYGVEPHIPEPFMVALLWGRVAGTILVEKIEDLGVPLTQLYAIPGSSLPKTNMTQWSRFTANAPFARAALCYGAAEFALNMGRNIALLEAKPLPIVHHTDDGVQLHRVQGARLLLEHVEESVRYYYETPPPPMLYSLDVGQMRVVYERLLRRNGVNVTLQL